MTAHHDKPLPGAVTPDEIRERENMPQLASTATFRVGIPVALKPGWKTSEFWVTALTIAGLVVSSFAASLAPRYAAMGAAISAGLYAVSRGLAKMFPSKGGAP